MMNIRKSRISAILFASALLAGCGSSDDPPPPPPPPPQNPQCPAQGTSMRWESFAKPFFESYCVDCHSSTRSGAARNGAPEGADWDSFDAVRAWGDRIATEAGADNEDMPPAEITHRPSRAEREQLAEWIACGMPSGP